MYVEGDFFIINEVKHTLRIINKHLYCWLEPILFENEIHYITGGINSVYHVGELAKLKGDWIYNIKDESVFKVDKVWGEYLLHDNAIDMGDVSHIRYCRLATEEEIKTELKRRKIR